MEYKIDYSGRPAALTSKIDSSFVGRVLLEAKYHVKVGYCAEMCCLLSFQTACSHIPMTANCCSNLVKEAGYVFRLRVNHVDRPVRKSIQIVKKQPDLCSSFFTLGKYLNAS